MPSLRFESSSAAKVCKFFFVFKKTIVMADDLASSVHIIPHVTFGADRNFETAHISGLLPLAGGTITGILSNTTSFRCRCNRTLIKGRDVEVTAFLSELMENAQIEAFSFAPQMTARNLLILHHNANPKRDNRSLFCYKLRAIIYHHLTNSALLDYICAYLFDSSLCDTCRCVSQPVHIG